METRYYFIFAAVALLLQLFIFVFNRTAAWLFNLSRGWYRTLTILSYLAVNSLLVVHFLRIYPIYRVMALILAILLFIALTRLAAFLCYQLGKKWIAAEKLNCRLRLIYPVALCGLIGLSIYNAYMPQIIHYQVTLDKPLTPIRIGVASDLHLGKLVGARQLDKLAAIFQQEKVDIILLPGDIMDDNISAYLAEQMQPHLAKLHAPLGVYATLGNHDFFGEQQAIKREINKAGIRVLWDESLTINHQFVLIGRNDNLLKSRPTTANLLKHVDTKLPVILMDHRPDEIEIHAKLPIDIQVSGHAHRGQIFPANLITYLLYKLDYGYEKIGNGHFFVTSGYGFWGIPMRLGSQAEVFIIDVKGK